jgi:hypothetical protein
MNSRVIVRIAIRAGFILSVLMTTYGCNFRKPATDETSHNLKHLKCDSDVTVFVTSSGLSSPDDDAIFVCAGNKVQWVTDESNFMFTIAFDPATNPHDLFGSPSSLPSKPDPSHTHQYITDVQMVKNTAMKFKDYSYSIQPPDKTSKPAAASDPHVIPM